MKAVLCKAWGPPESLVVEDVVLPAPGPGEVHIEVKAASVNYPDVLIIQKKYQVQPPLPFTPGSEAAGVVRAVGEGVRHVKPGDRVIAFTGTGAFAEELIAPASGVIPLPGNVPDEVAASFTLVYGTSHHAVVDRAALKAGETMLVLGAAGGVGLAAVEIGKALGARVIAAASSGATPTGPPAAPAARTSSTTRWVASMPSPPSAPSPGAAAIWWWVLPTARSRSCRSTSRC
jgi:NADPH2:quinone reductase